MSVNIEKGVPMPGQSGSPGDNVSKTLRDMDVGDSFLLPKAKRNSVFSQAKVARVQITTRTVDDKNVRVWRRA